MPFDANKYNSDYKKENYDQIILRLPKGKKAYVRQIAEENNITMRDMFIKAVEHCYDINLTDK